jgi:hypothetical protein
MARRAPAGGADAAARANRKESAQGHAEGGGVTLKEIETRLRREPEQDKLDPKVVDALPRAVMRFVHADEAARLR